MSSLVTLRLQLIDLLNDKSVLVGDFKLSSGEQSTYYIDARATTMSARGLDVIGRAGLEGVRQRGWSAVAIGGLTLGADPVAYAIALASHGSPPEMDAFTVRKQLKEHGTQRQIEGCLSQGSTVVVVEDVITTGCSAIQAIESVRDLGCSVVGVLAVVDRLQGGVATIKAAGVEVFSLVTVDDLAIPSP